MNRNRLRLVMSVARGALLTVITAGNVYAQAPATPPPDVRLRGEQQERLQQGRDETQRRQLQASPNTLNGSAPSTVRRSEPVACTRPVVRHRTEPAARHRYTGISSIEVVREPSQTGAHGAPSWL